MQVYIQTYTNLSTQVQKYVYIYMCVHVIHIHRVFEKYATMKHQRACANLPSSSSALHPSF